ncbi:DUF2076 domain-containing protein [Devosia ginsengisoli]|uniref:DUF2076 domain-containing protein n=1 Tax=Devosia ginsengisoli TaxID=400770 RepID=UPI0026F31A28|nr:DUF2076 domain-containing protein [Devosia ginsengisoli]MCR6672743.1 DUF2076 domain-containing protein [Devosia ginsengisoli]
MPNQQDQQAINGLFDRIEDVARKSPPRDRDAEALIQQRLRDYPPAPYYMAQTILVQEQALLQAQERIEQLEASQRPSGGFLGGLFGDNDEPRRRPARSRGPWDRQQDGQGGGFLAGAAQTAMGVAGGMLLGSAIAGMLTGGAHAQDYSGGDPSADQDYDAGGDDFGGDDFDIGGDF